MAQVSIMKLTKKFGQTTAVNNLSIDVEDGEFLTLLGPSGCGKTTTLRCIAGFIPITNGKIFIGERLVSSDKPKISIPPEKRNLGMVFQSYAVWPHMNVYHNITYPLKVRRLSEKEIKIQAEKTIGIIKLTGLEERYPSELSGGQQQRVALGRAIIIHPDVLLLDEPLSNLDAKLREEMRFELKELQSKIGITIIYVTHDQSEAITMSKRIAVLSDGKLQQIGKPEEIYEYPENKFVASFIGKTNFLKGTIVKGGKNAKVQLLAGGIINIENSNLRLKDENVIIIVRPQNIILTKQKGKNSINVTVKSRVYLGDRFFYTLKYADQEILADIPISQIFKKNESLFMNIKKAAVLKA